MNVLSILMIKIHVDIFSIRSDPLSILIIFPYCLRNTCHLPTPLNQGRKSILLSHDSLFNHSEISLISYFFCIFKLYNKSITFSHFRGYYTDTEFLSLPLSNILCQKCLSPTGTVARQI